MTTGLGLASLGTFLIMANALPDWCIPDTPPQINIIPTTDEVEYDFNQDTRRLSQFDVRHSPYAPGVKTQIKGLHSGRIELNSKFQANTFLNHRTDEVCIHYSQIDIYFHIDPKIYITREHLPGTCQHKVIHEHELKHLMTDRQLINEYSRKIGEAIERDLYQYGYIWGPMPAQDKDMTLMEMQDSLKNVVDPFLEELKKERHARQAAIDTIEEYERIRKACAD